MLAGLSQMFCVYDHETVFEGVLQCIDVPSVGYLAACCAGMRGGMVDDEGRLLTGDASITGDPALAHAVIRLVSPKLLQCVEVEECGTNICHSDFQHVCCPVRSVQTAKTANVDQKRPIAWRHHRPGTRGCVAYVLAGA